MPLSSVNYSGGVIITDWYSNNQNNNESVKISIRFLTNEIRSDALDIKFFKKVCKESNNCKVSESSGDVIKELKKKILKRAKIYEAEKKRENFKSYKVPKD
jgi:ribosome recycling factor